jgi:hypothetical protein
MSGDIRDPTGGATHFFSSGRYDGTPETAPEGDFRGMLRRGAVTPSRYRSRARGGRKNYFFQEEERE